ncbi:MAG TPA: NADPH:quinone reductase [Steroidobacteraceae bacterium]|jgi:NADPH2:quinone reductase|nr:NADPH:quinone reductase [Steroidobacteraceae bacterium]
MFAALYDRTGPAADVLRIEEIATPTPGPGEVRVELHWSGVNPSDVKSRAGLRTRTLPFPRIVPHSDGSGVIDKVGAGVSPGRVGERVWIWNGAWGRELGTAAQYIVVPEEQAVRFPAEIDLAAGACLGIPALTAWYALAIDGGVEGKVVLIAGGAGAVGHYAIQLAKIMGAARVLSTVSGIEKAELALAAGADVVLNYKRDNVRERIREAIGGEGIDRIVEVDFAANAALDLDLLRQGGDIIVYGSGTSDVSVSFSAAIRKHARVRYVLVYSMPPADRRRALGDLTRLLEQNQLVHNIAARLPLTHIAAAHELVESGRAVGNVVLEIE